MDTSALTIDELVELRESASIGLQSLVEAHQSELKAESERLAAIDGQKVSKPSRKVKYINPDGVRIEIGPKRVWAGTGTEPAWGKQFKALAAHLTN